MVKKKRQSKRVTLKMRYKIEKKTAEHHRQQRRQARKDARDGKVVMRRKDPGLPNLMPFKAQFLRKVLEDKEREEEAERERIRKLHAGRKAGAAEQAAAEQGAQEYADPSEEQGSGRKRKRTGGELSAEALLSAAARSAEFTRRAEDKAEEEAEAAEEAAGGVSSSMADGTRLGKKRHYMKELRAVVDQSDVILLVVDARDPMGCRAPQAEQMVMADAQRKRLVIVLNKIDLVPKKVVEAWLTELRKEFPTVAFRASQQDQKHNLGRAAKDSVGAGTAHSASGGAAVGDSICVGADTLLQLLKNYSRNRGIKTSITVGVVGYPNVGKSSVINSLKRERCVGVSSTPGFTKQLQAIQLDKKVKLIDSPGVLFQDSARGDQLVLRNCLSPADLPDPVKPVQQLIAMCDAKQLMQLYNLPRFDSPTQFLHQLALKRGKLKQGGVGDLDMAARLVLQDWNCGRIPYYVQPPKQSEHKVQSAVVSEWAKEFDLGALMAKEEGDMVEYLDDDDGDGDYAAVFEGKVPAL